MLIPKSKDNIEIAVRKKQKKEKFKFVGDLKPQLNQRVFELDLKSMALSECEYIDLNDTIHYLDAKYNTNRYKQRKVIIKDDCDYVIKLNLKNAVKYFEKKYATKVEVVKKNVKLFKKQNKVKLYKNK